MAKHNRRKGRYGLMWFFLILLFLVGFFWWSNHALQVESFTFSSQRLPESFDGYRLVVLSDFHGASFGRDNRSLFSTVANQHPDGIAVTGDLVDRFRGIDWTYVRSMSEGLASIAPVYYITGNHEWALGEVPQLKETLIQAGWMVLSNQYVSLQRGGEQLVIAGIDDPNGYADQKTPEELTTELHGELGDPFWILLAHRNDRFERQYSLLGADLTISGHAHGGLIRLPFTDGLVDSNRQFLPSYTAGFYTANGHTLLVSRGLGNSGISFRLFNRPEVLTVTLESKPSY